MDTDSISTIRVKIIIKARESYVKTQSKTASSLYPSTLAASPDKIKNVKCSHFTMIAMD